MKTMVKNDFLSLTAAYALCEVQGDAVAMMLLFDEEVMLFFSYDVSDEGYATLVLTCPRHAIEESAWEDKELKEGD